MAAKIFPRATVMEALRRLLPDGAQTLLLRAALDAGSGAEAWATWRTHHDLRTTLANDRAGIKGLLPLLASALEQNGAEVTSDDLLLLRMARYREALRSERYQSILRQTLTTLADGGIPFILLKGAALANSVYPEASLRHSHDIDLLIKPRDLPRVVEDLRAREFCYSNSHVTLDQAIAAGDVSLDHASGLPVVLHTRLFRSKVFDMPLDEAWQCARPCGGGLPGMMLAPEWEMVHIIGALVCAPARARVTWVCDAAYLIAAHPAMEWSRVCTIAGQCHLAPAVAVMLEYLRQHHQAPIPSHVIEDLQHAVSTIPRAAAEAYLQSARTHSAATYGDLFAAAPGWQERAFVLRWMLFPLPIALPRQQTTGWLLLFYLRRILRYLTRYIISIKRYKSQA